MTRLPKNPKYQRCRAHKALGLAAAFALGACRSALPPIQFDEGWSTGTAERTADGGEANDRGRVIPTASRQPWRYAGVPKDWETLPGREPSDHGGGAFERTVRIDAQARAYTIIGGTSELPEGARLLEDILPVGQERPVAVYAMRKLAKGSSPGTNDWGFAVLDPELRLAATGFVDGCPRCHAQAPHDGWFGPPAIPEPTMH